MRRLAALLFFGVVALAALSSMQQQGQRSGSVQAVGQQQYSVVGQSSLTVDRVNTILAAYRSPAAGKGQALVSLSMQYSIRVEAALAFFLHESGMGRYGVAAQSLSLGNIGCVAGARCVGRFAWFDSWEAGFAAWYRLIRQLYVDTWHLTTFDQIIPRYAPASDGNNCAAYISALKHAVDAWDAGEVLA